MNNKLIVLLVTALMAGYGFYALSNIPLGATPDITNNQVQVITTSQNLSTQDIEQFITYPVELEMANLPGVSEIRSISKFGLSVVTIVFDDDMGTYLPRQLIAEKIDAASQQIPEGFGTPEMGPITTGLGEIYQYILDTEPGYEDKYSATELRTIQDWVVRRQLSGIPGVVEVNSWGGNLKQYEVAINTEQLSAMNITVSDVFLALEKNNSVTGGGYIEREDQAYFIRGEGLISSLEDIENTVVTNRDGTPILIRDIAQVGFGKATRFGAITGNGQGEKVLGQVMMLKGANSNKVIKAVKQRVASISESLPEGVYINGFLDRSELISRTTFTITENLILGCLIVIFVVVLLLGNFRSGLVVGSVIPLCMLFALSMMYQFGVDANLMSLGAIDFGIIIDGAVIIVEFISFQITRKAGALDGLIGKERRKLKDKITLSGASKMMNSAVFGQLIILIVFIPILSLSGVEGKMFRPMALTFSFALVGAMLLCFTYVPVMASLFIKPTKESKRNISIRLMNFLHRLYEPIIKGALKIKKTILVGAVILLAITVYLFSTMGSEFVPTLDEGDFVIQPVLPTGMSLSRTVEITTQIEEILLEFPEVNQVVTRIGAAEVPTDPMSMEESDVIITLFDKKNWETADTKDGLADAFKQALAVIPDMEVEFTQPIEMRFNELITGVRADIAIKVFGEDLSILSDKASQIEQLIADVPGAADITVEKVEGLPQMNVKYKRDKIARYGLNIEDLNKIVNMGFGGAPLGSVFEGERRFDLVLRLDQAHRQDISHLQNLLVDTPMGAKVPLRELAEVTYQEGAAMISRDDTQRRIVVGVNVRNRDLQSVVDDVQQIIDTNLELPTGYSLTYGGQFENLQSARDRLLIAVPVSLLLIFFLLYMAFKSVQDSLIIYSAIPLAAVGGIWFLWLRDMPFSISAGVGFIALFGIAVLNGIVLIEHFKELKREGMEHSDKLIIIGAKDRLRAVLLTASAAALGFLPMAVSTNAGAEVQRPLATVVIGGLLTATLLTLVVLPILYSLFGDSSKNKQTKSKGVNKLKNLSLLLILLGIPALAQDQQDQLVEQLSFEEIKTLALENNASLRASSLEVDRSEALKAAAFDFDKTEVFYSRDQVEPIETLDPLKTWGVRQEIDFPLVYFAQKKVGSKQVLVDKANRAVQEQWLLKNLSLAYQEYQFEYAREKVLRKIDSLYSRFSHAATRRYELGETNYLEKITAQAKQRELYTLLEQSGQDLKIARENLQQLVQAEKPFEPIAQEPQKMQLNKMGIEGHVQVQYHKHQIELAQANASLEKQELLPDLSFEYFRGLNKDFNDHLSGFQVGLKIPLIFSGNAARIKAQTIATDIARTRAINMEIQLQAQYNSLLAQLEKHQQALSYYEQEGADLSNEILNMASLSYENGEIDFFQYIQSLENAYQISLSHLENLHGYNQTVIAINNLILN